MANNAAKPVSALTTLSQNIGAAVKWYGSLKLVHKIMVAGIPLVLFATFMATRPDQGTWRYGLCRIFLERETRFPGHIKVLVAGETTLSATIGYLTINPFGTEQTRLMECHFTQTPQGIILNKVTVDRKPLPAADIDAFNSTIPVLMTQNLTFDLPPPLPSNLADLKD